MTGSAEDQNGHILEHLGPPCSPWNLAHLVHTCLHHNVLHLAHWQLRQDPYFVLVICTFRNYGEVGCKVHVLQRLANVMVELETRCNHNCDDGRARAPLADVENTTHGCSRAGGGGGNVKEKAHAQTGRNELGLLGMDCKQEAMVTVANISNLANDLYSLLGM